MMEEEDFEALKRLVVKHTRERELYLETSVNNELQMQGDDAVDFLVEYAEIFRVDVSRFPFNEYFYNEGALSNVWFSRLLGIGKKKKPLYIRDLMEGIRQKILC